MIIAVIVISHFFTLSSICRTGRGSDRTVGKTAFYFLATEELESQSMKRLAGVIARTTKNTLLQKAVFTDWLDLFRVIADYKPEEKKVLVIDEFPYL